VHEAPDGGHAVPPCKQVAAGSALAPGSLAYGLALLALCVSAAWQR